MPLSINPREDPGCLILTGRQNYLRRIVSECVVGPARLALHQAQRLSHRPARSNSESPSPRPSEQWDAYRLAAWPAVIRLTATIGSARLRLYQPQDHVAIGLARPAHCCEPIDNARELLA